VDLYSNFIVVPQHNTNVQRIVRGISRKQHIHQVWRP